MTYLMHSVSGIHGCNGQAGIFTRSIHNMVVSALVFIPSGGRVGAARLIRV